MALGNVDREVFMPAPPQAALQAILGAGQRIGSVVEQNANLLTVTVKTRYGLQSVKLRVSILPADGGSRIVVSGFGGDIWGGGARKGTDKLLAALG